MIVTNIPVSKIIPNPKNPRKFFGEREMGTLKASIKAHGIKEPLTVQIQDDGTYILLNGERRYRASKELNLKEVPAIIEPKKNDVQQMIEMFHLQEQHQGWSTIEKAMAVAELAENLNSSIQEIGKLLAIPDTQIGDYISFVRIADKNNFEQTRISVREARKINALKAVVKKIAEKYDELTYNRTLEKQLENAIYARINDGQDTRSNFYSKIRDSFVQQPKMIQEFIENKDISVDELFKKSKARGNSYSRKIHTSARWMSGMMEMFLSGEVAFKITEDTTKEVAKMIETGKRFVSHYSD